MHSARILFVDDEDSIRLTLPPVLKEKGFKVAVAASVAEALVEINTEKFDVLIADLNLAEEGDGFLVISAMRHIQPQCVNLILTGYPALETALQAIHSQVDDYLTKPTDLDVLINTINEKLSGRKSQRPTSVRFQRLSTLLQDYSMEIGEHMLDSMKHHPQISAIRAALRSRMQADNFKYVSCQAAATISRSRTKDSRPTTSRTSPSQSVRFLT